MNNPFKYFNAPSPEDYPHSAELFQTALDAIAQLERTNVESGLTKSTGKTKMVAMAEHLLEMFFYYEHGNGDPQDVSDDLTLQQLKDVYEDLIHSAQF